MGVNRQSPEELVYSIGCDLVGLGNCWLGEQRSVEDDNRNLVFRYPAIVYYVIGHRTISTIDRGPYQTALAIRVDVRDTDAENVRSLTRQLVERIRDEHRLSSDLSLIDESDPDLGIYRRIRTLLVT